MIREWWDALPRKGWDRHAACRGREREPWFSSGIPADAKRVCATCPVIDDCLVFALRTEFTADGRHGVFGGMTGPERDRFAARLFEQGIVVGDLALSTAIGRGQTGVSKAA